MAAPVQVGRKAPQFSCEAVTDGLFEEVSLDSYLAQGKWICLSFLPAAFSFVCPTEVLAFNNCLDEFRDRNCEVLFVSTDSKHSLWHWQNLPRNQGGLGRTRCPLLSDQSHAISRTYGILQEDVGQDLRGTFIIDSDGVIQQITINNIAVGRSVLEMLRLVEAFQAARERGGLCPAGWKAGDSTIAETYDARDSALDSLFTVNEEGDEQMQVKNLDTDTMQSFSLTLPERLKKPLKPSSATQSRRQSSAGLPMATGGLGAGILSLMSANGSAHARNASWNASTATTAASSKRSSMQPAASGVVTLDFADPLNSLGVNTDAQAPTTPHEYVSMNMDGSHSSQSGKQSRSPSNASAASVKKETNGMIEALKRVSGTWSAVSSPRSEVPPSRRLSQGQVKYEPVKVGGYFD